MKLTVRQKAYREYLRSEHWKQLRLSAIERDGGKCVRCPSSDRLQVHHRVYRGRWEDGVLEDVESLCRKCHRLEHGYGSTDFESKWREIERCFRYQKRPAITQWLELKALMEEEDSEYAIIEFGELMFQYVLNLVAHEREAFAVDWWMDKQKSQFWFRRAFNVRKSIQERINVRQAF